MCLIPFFFFDLPYNPYIVCSCASFEFFVVPLLFALSLGTFEAYFFIFKNVANKGIIRIALGKLGLKHDTCIY